MGRRLFLQINMTIDGYVEDANGDIDWHFADAEFDAFILDTLRSIDGMVFGRVAFEKLAGYWPTAEQAARSDTQRKTARLMNELPKYVVSQTLTGSDWAGSHVVSGDVRAEILRLKARPGDDLALFAGAVTARSFIRLGLVDELRLIVNPLLQGGGTRLFDGEGGPVRLALANARPFASGAVVLTYVPVRQER
jgi:dihydrofolate reductase